MRTRVNARELRRYIVRIDAAEEDRTLGTGFFVAPGWVLTCAHVVFDGKRDAQDRVRVVPDASVHPGAVPAQVEACSEPPQGTILWPFPDLALVRLLFQGLDHPCVRLYPGDPVEDCHAWGFSRREDGVAPSGSPASFHFEGVEGDGYLKLKAGQAAPGLSGAPLLCPARRAVVGVVSATRDVDSDLGGWAAPVQALLYGGPGVPHSLTAHAQAIAAGNTTAAVADRIGWSRVLPIDGAAHLLDQPWSTFRRTPRSKPSELLLADVGVVPYLFRDEDLDHAQDWCEQPAPVGVAQVAARGGAGKTRFAIELCRRMAGRGWTTGLWHRDQPLADIAATPLPRLVVIDYTEAVAVDTLRNALRQLALRADPFAPVRLLLLTRSAATGPTDLVEEIAKNAPATLRGVLGDAQDNDAARTLTVEQRTSLYDTAVRDFARAWHGEQAAAPRPQTVDLAADRFELPLDVLFEAFDHALTPHQPHPERPPADRVLDHEQRYWDATAPADLPAPLRRTTVALATLAGAASPDEADQLLSTLPDLAPDTSAPLRQRTGRWLASLYAGSGHLNPLRPDRLGEALAADVLAHSADHGLSLLNAVLDLPSDDQIGTCLDLLARLTAAQPHADTPVPQILATRHIDLILRAEAQARGTPDRPGRLTITTGLLRLLTDTMCERLAGAEPGNAGYARDLSVSYIGLGDLARASGRGEVAEGLYRQSLAIAERLAGAEPGNAGYARDLSVSYDRLGDLARASGRGEVAEGLYRQSLAIRERLAGAEPGNAEYARDLSLSYERLGEMDLDEGRASQAADWFQRAVAIRRRLHEREPLRIDLAEELCVALYFLARTGRDAGDAAGEVRAVLDPFERAGTITSNAAAALRWARGGSS